MQPLQQPERRPKWRRNNHIAIIHKQQHLEQRRGNSVLFAVPLVARQVAEKALVEAVVKALGFNKDVEDEIFGACGVGPESVSLVSM